MANTKGSKRNSGKRGGDYKFSYARVVIFLIITGIALASLLFSSQLEHIINKDYYENLENISDAELVYNKDDLTVSFVNVGSADGIVIELPDNKVMIIDTGNQGSSKQSLMDYLGSNVYNDRSNNIVDYYIITHPDQDHFSGTKDLTTNYKVKNIYRPKVLANDEKTRFENDGENTIEDTYKVKTTGSYNTAINAIYNEVANDGATMYFNETGIVISGSDATNENMYKFTFLSPDENVYLNGSDIEENSYSAVLMLEYKSKKILLTGDATGVIENEVMSNASTYGISLKADILKIAHHGSATYGSNSVDFLNAVKPSYAIISCEEGAYSNLPASVVLNRIKECGVAEENILRTDKQGTVLVGFSDSNELMVMVGDEIISKVNTIIFIHWYYVVIVVIVLSGTIIFMSNKKAIKTINKMTKKSKKA